MVCEDWTHQRNTLTLVEEDEEEDEEDEDEEDGTEVDAPLAVAAISEPEAMTGVACTVTPVKAL